MCTHYAQRGGRSTDSAGCGLFFVAGGSAFSHINWFFGAALLLFHIILIVVVILTMLPVVGPSLFLPSVVLVMPVGELALLYCASYYTLRGGISSYGAYCGVFFVRALSSAGIAGWNHGAALL